MSTLYITGLPDPAGLNVVKALRTACEHLTIPLTYAEANFVLEKIQRQNAPYLLGSSEDADAIRAARLALAGANVTCAQDLPEDGLSEPEPEPVTSQSVSYMSAQMALAAMRLAAGEPSLALHHVVLLGHAAGEDIGDRGQVFQQAAAFLLDTFPPDLGDKITGTITTYTGHKPQED